jgi:predicted Zn-dependent protease
MEFARAAELFELGRKLEPYDNAWLQQLVRVYAQTNDTKRLIEALRALVPTDADDFLSRKRLARLLLDANRNAEAEKMAREALEIDLRDGEVREILLKALAAQKKDAEADKLRELFGN